MPIHGVANVIESMQGMREVANEKLIGIYTRGLQNMVYASPVHYKDGGRFRNNWFLKVGSPSGKTRNKSVGGGGSLSSIGRLPASVLNKKIYFVNNTPYATVIEYGGFPNPVRLGTNTGSGFQKLSSGGYSKQAPHGVVRVELVKMRRKIREL